MLATIALMLTTVISSYYWQGTQTASGERFNPMGMTCAHKTLPFGTVLRLERQGRVAFCRVNDRGPFIKGRSLDVSKGVAQKIGLVGPGVGPVDMEIVGGAGVWGDKAPAKLKKHVDKRPYKETTQDYRSKNKRVMVQPKKHSIKHWDLSSTFRYSG